MAEQLVSWILGEGRGGGGGGGQLSSSEREIQIQCLLFPFSNNPFNLVTLPSYFAENGKEMY